MAGAGGATIGALRAILGIDTVDFDKGLKDAQSSLASFGKSMASVAAGVGLERMVEGAARAITDLAKHSLELADNLGKASQKIGIPVAELSQLKFAAELSDVSLQTLTGGLTKLSKNLVEAVQKPSGEAAQALKTMGISATDSQGKLKGTSQILGEIADSFEAHNDGAAKAALASKIFGKQAGPDLIPLLNQGRDGIEKARKEAEKFGLTISDDMAKRAEEFNDNMKRLSAIMQGQVIQATAAASKELKRLSENLLELAQSKVLGGFTEFVIAEINKFINEFKLATLSVEKFGEVWTEFVTFLKTTEIFGGKIAENFQKVKDAASKASKEIELFKISLAIDDLASRFDMGLEFLGETTRKATKAKKDFNVANEEGKKALDDFITSQEKATTKTLADAATVGMAAGEKEKLRIVSEGLRLSMEKTGGVSADFAARLQVSGDAAAAAAEKLKAAQITQETLQPWEQYIQQLSQIAFLQDGTAKGAELFARAQQRAAEQTGQAWNIAGSSIVGVWASAFNELGKKSSAFAKIGKALSIVQTTIDTYTAAVKAIAQYGPNPIGYAAAAGAIAFGLAKIATIKSTNIPAMASGGSFRVPGGIGGGDRIFTPLMLEPGERVDVHSNNAQHASGKVVTLSVQGKIFDRDTIAEIIDGINSALGDQHVIKFAPA